jgi:hypothetical protein
MSLRIERIAADAAEMDVLYGIIAGVSVAILRALGIVGVLAADGPTLYPLLVENVIVFALVVLFTYGVYRQRSSAAIALAVLFAIIYFYSWYLLQKAIPPLGLIGLLIWYGLYRGIRGTRFLTRRRRSTPSPMEPVDERASSR